MYKRFVLDNGLRIILAPKAESKVASVIVLVRNGFEYEPKELNGISHFWEHMSFRGTEKRPTSKEISRDIESKGGFLNAFTGEEIVVYCAKIPAAHLEVAVDLISDMLLNSKLGLEHIEREIKVIIEEINAVNDSIEESLEELWAKFLYKGTLAGRSVLGTKTSVRGITREKLQDYLRNHYRSQNIVISVAGNIDCQKTLALIERYFLDISRGDVPEKPKIRISQDKPAVLAKYKETEQTHFYLGVRMPTFNIFSPQVYAIKLLNMILGGNTSSRLFLRVREEMGLAYEIKTDIELFTDRSHLYAYAGTAHQKTEEAIRAICDEYKNIAQNGVSPEELEAAKEYKIGTLTVAFEDSLYLASFLGEYELFLNKILTPEEEFKNFRKVKTEDINHIAKTIFQPKNLNLVLIGPHKNEKRFEKILTDF